MGPTSEAQKEFDKGEGWRSKGNYKEAFESYRHAYQKAAK